MTRCHVSNRRTARAKRLPSPSCHSAALFREDVPYGAQATAGAMPVAWRALWSCSFCKPAADRGDYRRKASSGYICGACCLLYSNITLAECRWYVVASRIVKLLKGEECVNLQVLHPPPPLNHTRPYGNAHILCWKVLIPFPGGRPSSVP